MKYQIFKSLLPVVIILLICQNLIAQKRINNVPNQLMLESFEGEAFPPEGWKRITNFDGRGWQRVLVDSQIIGFPSTVTPPPDGENAVALCSWSTGDADADPNTDQPTDQWLITPQIINIQPGDSLIFYLKYHDGRGDSLEILISTEDDTTTDFVISIDVLDFFGSTNNDWTRYSYALDDSVEAGSNIYIAFREHVGRTRISGDALLLDLVEVTSMATSVEEVDTSPNTFELQQNYPNPFNPSTTISFSVPQNSEVTLEVFNLLGQVVATLINGELYSKGEHRVLFNASNLASGIYYYRMQASNRSHQQFVEFKKMLFLK